MGKLAKASKEQPKPPAVSSPCSATLIEDSPAVAKQPPTFEQAAPEAAPEATKANVTPDTGVQE
eukprot:14330606-Alexandrium_andersonii.AAC.1